MHFRDSIQMAFVAIRAHKLRSVLTLTGIVAGVASIIGVMTGISVVQSTMEREMSVLGSTTFQVQKWPPRGLHRDVDWREIEKRMPIRMEDVAAVRKHTRTADLVGAEYWRFGTVVSYRETKTDPKVTVCGGDPQYAPNNTHHVEIGRNLSEEDMRVGRAVAVIGNAIALEIFPFTDPIDKVIKVDGRKFTIVGVFESKESALGGGYDNYVLMPINVFAAMYGSRTDDENSRSINMTVNALSPAVVDAAIAETRAILRQARGVPAGAPDDFYVFTNDSQVRSFQQTTAGVKAAAFVVGAIALLVAGVGIMNIMLVSVTERTREIGIRKALGARRRSILMQFLLEAVVLCNIGGIGGVVVGFGLGNVVTFFTDFAVHVPWEWAFRGLTFCSLVGVVFGMWPAIRASRLSPVVAFMYE